jgi:hypothetical protein
MLDYQFFMLGIVQSGFVYYLLFNKGNKPPYWPIFLSWIGVVIYVFLWITKYNGKD